MLVLGFPSGPLQANCYVLAPAEGQQCVVIDPGQDATSELEERLRQHRLTLAGVLLTHGHFDHVSTAREVCASHGVPTWIHPGDRFMLSDPGAALGPELRPLVEGMFLPGEPSDVRELADGDEPHLAGMTFHASHAPGHTAGSVLLSTTTDEGGQLLFTGDTLFAGAIGRTDLPDGDHSQMLHTLRTRVLPLADETLVLPGHGPTSTIGRERASNPFLEGLTPTTVSDSDRSQ